MEKYLIEQETGGKGNIEEKHLVQVRYTRDTSKRTDQDYVDGEFQYNYRLEGKCIEVRYVWREYNGCHIKVQKNRTIGHSGDSDNE